MCGKYSLTKFAYFLIIVLRAEIATTFCSKVTAISARNTKIFARLHFPILQDFVTKFWNFTSFERFFRRICFFVWISLDQKLVYNGNCPLCLSRTKFHSVFNVDRAIFVLRQWPNRHRFFPTSRPVNCISCAVVYGLINRSFKKCTAWNHLFKFNLFSNCKLL